MDLNRGNRIRRLGICCMLMAATGCAAPNPPVPTFWQKLGLPQAGARMRDGLVNRRGNFPGLEKKPPVLALADPANLDPKKPEMIQAAAQIKQDQDLKKQKIKAIKFLAEVNCGCYNKDGKVEEAFIAALDDCDPDVRLAAIEGLDTAAGPNCGKCNVCCTTCNTKKVSAKLEEIAWGLKDGCPIEPVKEIRDAANALICKCPPPPEAPIEPEELIPPDPVPIGPEPNIFEGKGSTEQVEADEVTYRLSDDAQADDSEAVMEAGHTTLVSVTSSSRSNPTGANRIANPDQLVSARVVTLGESSGDVWIQMPDTYQISQGCRAIVVDGRGRDSLATVADVRGRRILLNIEDPDAFNSKAGQVVKIGILAN